MYDYLLLEVILDVLFIEKFSHRVFLGVVLCPFPLQDPFFLTSDEYLEQL
jgi:hypothetical protein